MNKKTVKIDEKGGDTYIYHKVDKIEIIDGRVSIVIDGNKRANHLLDESEILVIDNPTESEESD